MLVPKRNTEEAIQLLKQTINSIKADEDVFVAILKKQPFYETGDCDSIIRFGNSNSKLQLTILSNPYCNPCAVMHKNIEALLTKVNNGISVQYILSSFNEKSNSTNRYLIAACLSDNTAFTRQIFKDWFEKGKELKDDYFKKLSLNMNNPKIEIEFLKHESWKDKTQIRATPTVLVNGYQLPENYKIEDLRYFTDLDL
ncbi:MAG: DsbA family protein [Tannerella sp.]|jgi:protein-disulfide isomerase|nr:DsbA family protein [Tannerella sp.]